MTRKSVYLVDFDCYRPPDELNLKMSYQKQGEMVSTVSLMPLQLSHAQKWTAAELQAHCSIRKPLSSFLLKHSFP